MIKIEQKGDFSNLTKYLNRIRKPQLKAKLEKYGQKGIDALASATPKKSGLTASSWYYIIEETGDGTLSISFDNSNVVTGVNIAIILDTGHGTKNGGWVQGRHYIDSAIQPIMDQLANEAWEEVTRNG